ncbi:MAG: class I SAM-dependent methyltransferase [Flavobacteriales bacterium]|nr:class I SAM-dependent methyltransferase [Flavobacteriales bacterium]
MSLDLQNVSETLWIPLFGKAIESKRRDGLLNDQKAIEIANKATELNPKLNKWWRALSKESQGLMVWRSLEIDKFTKVYLEQLNGHKPVIVNLGAGLCTRYERFKDQFPELVWINIDLPLVKEAWSLFNEETNTQQYWTEDIFKTDWLERLKAISDSDVMFIAEGLFMYFSKDQVKGILNNITDHIQNAHIVMEVYSKIALQRPHPDVLRTGAKKFENPWGVDSGKEFEKWSDKLVHYEDSYFLKNKMALKRVPLTHRIGARIPFISKLGKIVYLKSI